NATALSVRRRWKLRSPRGYLEHAGTPRGIGGDERIAADQIPFEFMLNALRLNAGFSFSDFTAHTGLSGETISDKLDRARARGWLDIDEHEARATPLGRRFLNDVITSFLPDQQAAIAHTHAGPPHA
ncbi:MAG: hypothetical protein ABI304_07655, partial [Rudaea sp.]